MTQRRRAASGPRVPPRTSLPRVAIGQFRMAWTIEENMDAIAWCMRQAAAGSARICSFPELAVTGFHRQIVEHAMPRKVDGPLRRIAGLCQELGMAVAVGAPTFDGDLRFNSHLLVDERGVVLDAVPKNGLTPAEATFFAHGRHRPVASLAGLACTAVICREIDDRDDVLRQVAPGSVDLVFWPGQMRPDPDKPPQDPPAHVCNAQALARELGAFVVQANWPNALNRPEQSAGSGRSAVIAPDGELLFRLPQEAPGVAVFALGAREFAWHPQ